MLLRSIAAFVFVAAMTIAGLSVPLVAMAQNDSTQTTEQPAEDDSGDGGTSVELAEPDC